MTRLSGRGWGRAMLRCALPLSVSAALLAPASAGAAPAFLATDQLSGDISGTCPIFLCLPTVTPDVAMDRNGNTIVTWVENDGSGPKLVFRHRPAGGAFAAKQTVGNAVTLVRPRVAFDGDGNATFAYIEQDTTTLATTVTTATRSADGTVSTPAPVGPLPIALGFDLAVGPEGDAVVAWVNGTSLMASTRAAGGTFQPAAPVAASTPGLAVGNSPGTAVDDDGNIVIVWPVSNLPTQHLYAAYKPAGGSFPATGDELDSTTTGGYFTYSVRFDGDGNATAAWTEGVFAVNGAIEVAEKRASDAAFGTPVPVTTNSMPGPASLAVAEDGRAIIAFARNTAIEVATRPAGGSFGTPQPVGGTTNAVSVTAVVGRSGKGLLLTTPVLGGAQARELSVTGVGTAVKDYAGSGTPGVPAGSYAVAVDDDGNGAIADSILTTNGGGGGPGCIPIPFPGCGGGTSTERVSVTGFDGAGPSLRSLQVPTTGTTGEALSFAVAPVDVWSSVTSTSWDFGDGGNSSGANAQHAYGEAGDYTAAVTATDSLGNTSTASRTVAISSPPPPSNGGDNNTGGTGGGGPTQPQTPQAPVTPSDVNDPILGALSMQRRTFAVASKATPTAAGRKRRTPKGSAFRFSLSEVARVKIVIEKKETGRRSGRRCVKPTKKNRKAKKCTRWVKSGELTRNGAVNRNNVPFTGRIGRKALKVGSYRASLVATDAAGNASSPTRITFKIVR